MMEKGSGVDEVFQNIDNEEGKSMVIMDRKKIEERVMEIVGDHLGIPILRLNAQIDIRKDLGADELDLRELIITIEESFHIKISNKKMPDIKTIKDIVDKIYIMSCVKTENP